MRRLLAEMLLTPLVFGLLLLGLFVLDPGWSGSVAMALAAFAALGALEITTKVRSARDRILCLIGEACLIAALVLFWNEDDGAWIPVAFALLVVGVVCTSRARKRSTFLIELRRSEAAIARDRRWTRRVVIAMLASLVLVFFGVPWWTTIFVSVIGGALIVYQLWDSFRVVRREVDQQPEV